MPSSHESVNLEEARHMIAAGEQKASNSASPTTSRSWMPAAT